MAKRPGLPSSHSTSSNGAAKTSSSASSRAGNPASSHTIEESKNVKTTRPRALGKRSAVAVDVRGWLGGVRLSTFMLIMLFLVIVGVLVLVPTIGTYAGQQQRISALREQVSVAQDRVDQLQAEQSQWNDSAYVATQARERLYYHLPGEVVFLVINDLDPATQQAEQKPVSAKVEEASNDWMSQILRSVTEAGLSRSATTTGENSPETTTPDPSSTPPVP